MQIYVARHAEAEHNPHDVFHDATVQDISLTSRGVGQAQELADNLREVAIEVIFVSELLRTRQTAEIVNQYHQVPIIVDSLLNDIVSGIVGRPVAEFKNMIASSPDPWNERFKGGESYNESVDRARAFLKKLRTENYGTLLVVTSGGIANNLYGLPLGLSNDQMYHRSIDNAAVTSFKL